MDNLVTGKFFIVRPEDNHAPNFLELLRGIRGRDLTDREVDINPGVDNPIIVRLERLDDEDNGFVTGELIRKQTENIPPEANNNGLEPIELSEGGGLAYSSAFVSTRQLHLW